MAAINNILDGDDGLNVRIKLLLLIDFYNKFVKSDGSYTLQSFLSKNLMEFKGATDGFSKIEFIPTDGGAGIINVYNNAGVLKTTINGSSGITSQAFIKSGGTSSQFLKADGSIDSIAYQTALINGLADILAINRSTGGLPIKSPDGLSELSVIDGLIRSSVTDGIHTGKRSSVYHDLNFLQLYYKDNIGNSGLINIDSIKNDINHNILISLNAPITVLEQGTASKILRLNASKEIVASSYDESDLEIISRKGAANGYASLDSSGLIPASQLPTYIDDVLEGTYISSTVFNNLSSVPYTPATGLIYVDTTTNLTYRWSGSIYVKLTDGGVNSFNSRTGSVLPQSGDYTTALVPDTTNKRYVTDAQLVVIGNTSGTNSGNETATTIGAIVNGATAYTTALDADLFGIWDFANSLYKKISLANLKATLAGFFTSYQLVTIASSATPTIATGTFRETFVDITALAVAITSFTTNLIGTPANGARMTIRIKDNGTARALTFGTSFEACGVTLPTTTTISKRTTVGFIWDSTTSKWGCVASVTEA